MSHPRLPLVLAGAVALAFSPVVKAAKSFLDFAPRPPMGWNSWDCFGTTVTEDMTKKQAAYMAENLKAHGWEYIIVDIQWYEPGSQGHAYREGAPLAMDGYGRLIPAPNKFPGSVEGKGFRPLADYVHSLGLKFGIHMMRGIPRNAVKANLPILGTNLHAQDVADVKSVCPWNPDMYGVDMTKPGGQEYYDSVFTQIADWGVDYVKVDDISRPYHDHQKEIEGIRLAIDKTSRDIVLSLSPGETALTAAEHVTTHANMWRISDDFWDTWTSLQAQFARLQNWNTFRKRGAWPDADMLPLGMIQLPARPTRFTKDEQRTLMTLWSIARSPLMHGGDMLKTDADTLALLTNDEVLEVNQYSVHNRPVSYHNDLAVWTADVPNSRDKYVALFNARDPVSLEPSKAAFRSDVISSSTPGHGVDIDIPLKDVVQLVLVADNASDDANQDHAVWVDPRVVLADGTEKSLTELKWDRAEALWEQVSTEKSSSGKPISLNGQVAPRAISIHAKGVLHYTLPAGAVRFKARAGLEDEAVANGQQGKVRLSVFTGTAADVAKKAMAVSTTLEELGLTGVVEVRDLWTHKSLGTAEGVIKTIIPWHGAALFRLTPKE